MLSIAGIIYLGTASPFLTAVISSIYCNGPGRKTALRSVKSAIDSGPKFVRVFFIPSLSNWKTPFVLPLANISLKITGSMGSESIDRLIPYSF